MKTLFLALCLVAFATFATAQTPITFVAMPVTFTNDSASGPQGGLAELQRAGAAWTEFSYGRYTYRFLLAPSVALDMARPKTCDYQSWNSKVLYAAQALGMLGSPLYFHPALSCPEHTNAAQATCGYGPIWFNGQDSDEIVEHEMGHHGPGNDGRGVCPHSSRINSLYPMEHYSLEGAKLQERGDPHSIMGGSYGHPTYREKLVFGLVDLSQTTTVLRTFTSTVIALRPIEQPNGLLNVTVYRADGGNYDVELRTPAGIDARVVQRPTFVVRGSLLGFNAWAASVTAATPVFDDFSNGVKVEYVDDSHVRISTYSVPEPTAPPEPTYGPVPTQRPAGQRPCFVASIIPCTPTPTPTRGVTSTPTSAPASPTASPTATSAPPTRTSVPTALPAASSPTPTTPVSTRIPSTTTVTPTATASKTVNGGDNTSLLAGIGLAIVGAFVALRNAVVRFYRWLKSKFSRSK